jgi:uncharacterized repeat protein (TIGR01451 family)
VQTFVLNYTQLIPATFGSGSATNTLFKHCCVAITIVFMKKNYLFLPLVAALLFTVKLNSQVIQAFNPVISVTQKGDITFAANSITQCTGAGSACTNGRAEVPPAGLTHNQTTGITIGYIDNDGGTGIGAQTFSSSSSTLDMGGVLGCGVIYAYLTWGGFVTTGTVNYTKRDSVYFQVPGGSSYNKLKADLLVDNTAPYNRTYHCYKDVTSLVKAAGPGIYTTGNVVAATGGNNQFAGWTLVVLYSDPTKSLKNLTIFRGLAGVSGTSSVQFNISGFFTPPTPAPVNVKLGFVAYDGDRAVPNAYNSGLAGDSLKFNGVAVSNGKNPASDIFNSTITNNNAEYVRTPAYTNTLGYDADIITLANGTYSYLGNSASSATLRMSSGGETILADIVTTAIDVFEPEMRFDKTFVNLSGNNPAQLGDLLEYTLTVYNKGSDPADSLTVIDSLYGALNYVPGSLSVVNGPNAGTKTDAAGDDQMEFVAAGNFIRARLGNGANGTRGGKLNNFAPDSVTTIRFRANITNDCTIFHCFDSVYNMAYATYYGQTSLQQRSTFSSANGIDPATGCALTGPTALKIVVPACALPADTTITACVAYNLNNILPVRPGYTTYYNSSWAQVTQANATGTYYALKTIYPSNYFLTPCYDTIQINFVSTGSCSLPVILSSFTGEIVNDNIRLQWVTQTEINFKEFIISRSADGVNFTDIGKVDAAGLSSNSKQYNFKDYNTTGIKSVFYRLALVDKDGSKRYSNIIHLRLDGYTGEELNIINIKPNPAVETAIVSVISAENGNCQLELLTANGQKVFKGTVAVTKNIVQQIPLTVANLEAGIYFIKLTNLKTNIFTVSKLLVK